MNECRQKKVMLLAIKTKESVSRFLWQNFANIWAKLCKTTLLLATKRIIKVVSFLPLLIQREPRAALVLSTTVFITSFHQRGGGVLFAQEFAK